MSFSDLFPFSKNSQPTVSLIFDIANGSVGGAIVSREKSTTTLLFTTRVDLPALENDADAITRALTDTVHTVAASVADAFRTAKDHRGDFDIHVFLHAPWASTRSSRQTVTLPQEAVITKEVLRSVTARMVVPPPDGFSRFDQQLSRIDINGYPTNNPYGKKAREVTLTLTESIARTYIMRSITHGITTVFPEHTMIVHTFMQAALNHMNMPTMNSHAVFIDCGNAYTTITALHDGVVLDTVIAPFGANKIIDAISAAMHVDKTHARDILHTYTEHACTPSQCAATETVLQHIEPTWTTAFGDALATLSGRVGKVSFSAYVFAREPFAAWFEPMIQKIDFAQFIMTARPFAITRVHATSAHAHVMLGEHAEPDTALAMEASL